MIIGIPLVDSVSGCMCAYLCISFFFTLCNGSFSKVPPLRRRPLGEASRGDGLLRAKVKRWGQDQDAKEPKTESWIASCCLQDYFGTY